MQVTYRGVWYEEGKNPPHLCVRSQRTRFLYTQEKDSGQRTLWGQCQMYPQMPPEHQKNSQQIAGWEIFL